MRVLDFGASGDGWWLRLEGPAGSNAEIGLMGEPVRVAGVEGRTPSGSGATGAATVEDRDPGTGRTTLSVRFPDGNGWSRLEIRLARGT